MNDALKLAKLKNELDLCAEEIERLQAKVTHQKNVISRYRKLASGKAALLAQHGIQETEGE